jgi:serine/threonine protein kinase
LFTSEGVLKIAEFGLSKHLDDLGATATVNLGTTWYRAPETVNAVTTKDIIGEDNSSNEGNISSDEMEVSNSSSVSCSQHSDTDRSLRVVPIIVECPSLPMSST